MIAAWMMYGTVAALLLALAAGAAERGLQLRRLPVRWAWVAALAGSLSLPVAAVVFPAPAAPEAAGVESGGAVTLGQPLMIAAALAPRPALPDTPLVMAWLTLSGAAVGLFAASGVALWRRRRGWGVEEVEGERVLVSADIGPAVVGFFRPRIVIPNWALRGSREERRLLLAHEGEHVRARDPLLVLGGLACVALMPWNPALWWQVRRLRAAVEVDCDARVLRRHPDVRSYGRLLLEMGRRAPPTRLAAAAFSENRSTLERRIRTMTDPVPTRVSLRVLGSLALAGLLFALACEIPHPTTSLPLTDTDGPDRGAYPVATTPDVSRQPQFTPYEVRPSLQNTDEFVHLLEAVYPPALKEAGIGGTAVLWVFIDERGRVGNTKLTESSGHAGLDGAARVAMMRARFTPALNEGRPVGVWIQLPITFAARPDPA